ncbi:phosphoribosylanthranilate isomerase [Selenomonas ruminantium]|jgi:phosphoribosylanthranilate isomerase|uniref:N-(5'-phosphoribosyl)anthranilate isomerase n=1 Tax=Selenomonas ruminantium TaxID=971 RepID=A0A1K1QXV1_SELRU|nr:phosphoribosylanthranilate isomerase [Selenomonas ruminantium]SFW64505.1 phosphoribosylanthranilate isomerase [Selenomonas ruminantium]
MRAKICGIKDLFTAKIAEEAGADFIGFVFYKKSHRYISPEKAAVISKQIKTARTVGVFVNEDLETVNEIAAKVGLDYVQLHGQESAEYAQQVICPVIKAYTYDEHFSVSKANEFPSEMILLDAGTPALPGGTGKNFNWKKAAQDILQLHKSVLVAGGINRENVKQVNKLLHPYAVDVSSSLEENNEKSIEKIQAFLRRIK